MSNNSFFDIDELKNMGFRQIGENVLLSRKTSVYGAEDITIGSNVRIDDFCILSGKIELGDYIHIAAGTYLYGGDEGIFMDDYSAISSHSSVYAASDNYLGEAMTNPMIPEKYRKVEAAKVRIGRHVIVGAGSIILPGANLEEGSSFGAMTLIKGTAKEWTVYTGIPMRECRARQRTPIELASRMLSEKND
jgi:galactoside O-acetyltransferase